MSKTSQNIFEFIKSEEIKTQLTSDLDELHKSMKNECWKASMVLIGSILESVLYNHINNTEELKKKIPKFTKREDVALSNLIQWSRKFNVIDENLFRLTEPIRDYRNLIHPRVQERLKTNLSNNLVQIGYNLLFEVIRSVKKSYEMNTSKRAKNMLNEIYSKMNLVPTKTDFEIYLPVIEKYGLEIGSKIVERSLKKSQK